MKQIGIIPAGCQLINRSILHITENYLIYASTLAIYFLNSSTFNVEKILKASDTLISCFIVSPHDSNELISIGNDGHMILWDVSEETIVSKISMPTQNEPLDCLLAWDPFNPDLCVVVFNSSKCVSVCVWNIRQVAKAGSISEVFSHKKPNWKATVVRNSPHRAGLFAFGGSNGVLFLINQQEKKCSKLLQESNKANPNLPSEAHNIVSLNFGSKDTKLQKVVDLQFDTLSATYLLVAYEYYIILWDVDTESQMQVFDRIVQTTMSEISSLNWLEWTAGNFAVTYAKSTTISVYNVSQKSSIESIKLTSNTVVGSAVGMFAASGCSTSRNYTASNVGFLAAVITNKCNYQSKQNRRVMWCCLADGSVLLYNLQRHQLEFHSSAGHTETIFACSFCPKSPDVVASVSFDENIKVWNLIDNSLVDSIPVDDGVIYCIDWNRVLNIIAIGTFSGAVTLYCMDTGKQLASYRYHQKAVFTVAWNSINGDSTMGEGEDNSTKHYLLSASACGSVVVNEIVYEDLVEHQSNAPLGSRGNRNILVSNKIVFLIMPNINGAFGACWHPFNRQYFAVAFHDGSARVYSMHDTTALVHLTGHSKRVFEVQWSPLVSGLIATTSDDCTIGVWNVSVVSLEAAVIARNEASGSTPIFKNKISRDVSMSANLVGHQSKVRGLCWNTAQDRILVSGSWDATIRVWDVLTGFCIALVDNHAADVYSIISHPLRPFQYISTSRDTTIRIWELDSVTRVLRPATVWKGLFDRCVPVDDGSGFDDDNEEDDEGVDDVDDTVVRALDSFVVAKIRMKDFKHCAVKGRLADSGVPESDCSSTPPQPSGYVLSGVEVAKHSEVLHSMYMQYSQAFSSEKGYYSFHLNLPDLMDCLKGSGYAAPIASKVNIDARCCGYVELSVEERIVLAKAYQVIFNVYSGGSATGMTELWETVCLQLQYTVFQETEKLRERETELQRALDIQNNSNKGFYVENSVKTASLANTRDSNKRKTPSSHEVLASLFKNCSSITSISPKISVLKKLVERRMLLEHDILARAKSDARQAEMNKLQIHSRGCSNDNVPISLTLTSTSSSNSNPTTSHYSSKAVEILRESALMHIRTGEFKKYCEIMMEINDWAAALALAPAVSHAFWKQMALKYAQNVINTNESEREFIPYVLGAGRSRDAIEYYLLRKEYSKAMVVAKMGEKRSLIDDAVGQGQESMESKNGGTLNAKPPTANDAHSVENGASGAAIQRVMVASVERLLNSAQPYLAAAQLIGFGKINAAVQLLSSGGSFDTAFAIARCFNCLTNSLLIQYADYMACNGEVEVAVRMLYCLSDAGGVSTLGCSSARANVSASVNHDVSPNSLASNSSGARIPSTAPGTDLENGTGSLANREKEVGLMLNKHIASAEVMEKYLSVFASTHVGHIVSINSHKPKDKEEGAESELAYRYCMAWTKKAEYEEDVGCDVDACACYMIGKVKIREAVRIGISCLKKSVYNVWNITGVGNALRMVKVLKYFNMQSPASRIVSWDGEHNGSKKNGNSAAYIESMAREEQKIQETLLGTLQAENVQHKLLLYYLLWYSAHEAAAGGYWSMGAEMLRILRGNVQVVKLAANSSAEPTVAVATKILSGFALSVQQLTVQELRFRILGGDVEKSVQLVQQMDSDSNLCTADGCPNRLSEGGAAASNLELPTANVNNDSAVQSLLVAVQSEINRAIPCCYSQEEANSYYFNLDQTQTPSNPTAKPNSYNAGLSPPCTVTMYRWANSVDKLFLLVHQLSEILGLPPTPPETFGNRKDIHDCTSSLKNKDFIGNNHCIGGDKLSQHMRVASAVVQGSKLPVSNTNSRMHSVSYISGKRVQGHSVVLEDIQSVVAINEALVWAKFFPFTPLLTGKLMRTCS